MIIYYLIIFCASAVLLLVAHFLDELFDYHWEPFFLEIIPPFVRLVTVLLFLLFAVLLPVGEDFISTSYVETGYAKQKLEIMKDLQDDWLMEEVPELIIFQCEDFNKSLKSWQAASGNFILGWMVDKRVTELQPIDIDKYTAEYK